MLQFRWIDERSKELAEEQENMRLTLLKGLLIWHQDFETTLF